MPKHEDYPKPTKDPRTCPHKNVRQMDYGTEYCKDCGSSKGVDGLWRR